MANRTVYVALAVCAALGSLFTLAEYYARGRNPLNRLGYSVVVSVFTALAAFIVLKLTNFFVPWRGKALSTWATTALIYFLLYLLVLTARLFL
jgi:predicted Abi (CAAX) family protease